MRQVRRHGRLRPRGAALLSAMLTVALVATFAAAALWQQWRSVEVESAERERVQAAWILTGGLDWARLVLREDGRASSGVDHLGEPWAVPLQEARLSSFLAADNNVSTSTDNDAGVLDAFLSGQITDLQSKLNVADLVQGGKVAEDWLASFRRLFGLLSLPQSQLDKLAENLRFALDTQGGSRGLAPLAPQRVEQLVWLGIPESTVAALQPYVTVLPTTTATRININTASAEVIHSAMLSLSMADAQRLVAARASAPLQNMQAAANLLRIEPSAIDQGGAHAQVNTSWFEIRSRLRLGTLVVEEHSVVQRQGTEVKVMQRWRGPPTPDSTAAGSDATMAAETTSR